MGRSAASPTCPPRLADTLTRAAGIARLGTALMLDATVAVSRLAPRFERAISQRVTRFLKFLRTLVAPVGGVPLQVVQDESRPRLAAAQAVAQQICNVLFTAHRQPTLPPEAEQLLEIPSAEEK